MKAVVYVSANDALRQRKSVCGSYLVKIDPEKLSDEALEFLTYFEDPEELDTTNPENFQYDLTLIPEKLYAIPEHKCCMPRGFSELSDLYASFGEVTTDNLNAVLLAVKRKVQALKEAYIEKIEKQIATYASKKPEELVSIRWETSGNGSTFPVEVYDSQYKVLRKKYPEVFRQKQEEIDQYFKNKVKHGPLKSKKVKVKARSR